jgi:hypothetical protein
MEESENTLEKALEALKNEQIPPGPPQKVIESTIAKLTESAKQADTVEHKHRILIFEDLRAVKSLTKIAAAAVLFIAAGYAAGRLSAPRPPNMEEIQAALEPKIRERLLDDTKQYLQLGLANAYVRLQDELSQQYRRELSRVALQSVAASNAVTNDLLTGLIESFNEAQNQDRQLVTAALEQIESRRLQDRTDLSNALATFALQTGDELMRTRQDMAHFLSYTQPGQSNRDEIGNSDK